ncbi:helix-turn-helix domain-containing protein [Mycobacterium sp. SMC-8]|uniref:helix-turn-helix domain-containing protein n=1 Tax=Mycobacterium sp. SMC-8 TaxID=2857060 RepID=UPI0021B16226|nr:helix-turn-helix domain-containing protein [Mycobacterium sp. SMC-8]UXA10394.1 helix-turn-helix domain-containing protein [Mycobacterium sp. SMC-8]
MVTVEADLVHVESRLAAGQIGCPSCPGGVLGGWGFARVRRIHGVIGPVRPRRGRCRSCRATHVLLPVMTLLRRGYAAQTIWNALALRDHGWGHRRIAANLDLPRSTVRGWLRRLAGRVEPLRAWFVQVAVRTGIDVVIPDGSGCGWRDLVTAVAAAAAAIAARFGPAGVLGVVTAPLVMVTVSGGRLLAPDWPPAARRW